MKIPLYFNYIENTFPKLLQQAVNSVTHDRVEVHVVRHVKPKPFTQCLNAIQRECLERGDRCWMFMHCDAEILDNSIIDMILERYENPQGGEKIASVCACAITDLLILYDTDKIQQLNGWDEKNFDNSYMEIDLHNRIIANNFAQPILYNCDCPDQMSHKESSSLRNKNKDGSLFKVYSKSYERDMRNFFSIYHPGSNVDANAGLRKWKTYVGNSDHFPKRDLNMVCSVGKTASTSLFRSWARLKEKLPVAHTHCLQWFTVVDFENSVFVENIRTNLKHTVYNIAKPSYVLEGCVEIKLNLKDNTKFGNVFPNLLFGEINVISVTRHPVHRRVSQFLNSLTCESLNTAALRFCGDQKLTIDAGSYILPQLKQFQPYLQKPTACAIARILTNVALHDDRLYGKSELIKLFKQMFVGVNICEYTWLFNAMNSMFNVDINVDEIPRNGYVIHFGNIDYSDIDESQKDSNSIKVSCIVLKMEQMSDPVIKNVIDTFTGIQTISHDRNITEQVPIVDADLGEIKKVLLESIDTGSLYKDADSAEFDTIKRLGYI